MAMDEILVVLKPLHFHLFYFSYSWGELACCLCHYRLKLLIMARIKQGYLVLGDIPFYLLILLLEFRVMDFDDVARTVLIESILRLDIPDYSMRFARRLNIFHIVDTNFFHAFGLQGVSKCLSLMRLERVLILTFGKEFLPVHD